MIELSRVILRALAATRRAPCVSIYMTTHAAGTQTREDPIRLRKLLSEAEGRLISSHGMRRDEAHAHLEPVRALVRECFFERCRGKGVAFFLAPGMFQHFELELELRDAVHVGNAFYLRPLTSLLVGDGRFFVLAVSRHDVRLLEATRRSVREVPLPGAPRTLEQFLGFGQNPQRRLQAHTGPRARGDPMSLFQGAAPEESAKHDLFRFFREIDCHVREALRDEHAPLVLATVDYMAPIYREANTYAHILEGHIPGSPAGERAEDLRDRALAVVEPIFAREIEDAIARYRRHAGSARTSPHLQDALTGAVAGRVEVLLFARDAERWGPLPREEGTTEIHDRPEPGDVDLIDFAAARAILHGGKAFAIDRKKMPADGDVAVLFRY